MIFFYKINIWKEMKSINMKHKAKQTNIFLQLWKEIEIYLLNKQTNIYFLTVEGYC